MEKKRKDRKPRKVTKAVTIDETILVLDFIMRALKKKWVSVQDTVFIFLYADPMAQALSIT